MRKLCETFILSIWEKNLADIDKNKWVSYLARVSVICASKSASTLNESIWKID